MDKAETVIETYLAHVEERSPGALQRPEDDGLLVLVRAHRVGRAEAGSRAAAAAVAAAAAQLAYATSRLEAS